MSRASIVTRNIESISNPTGNIYESINVLAKRANQITVKSKDELTSKLAEFASTVDNLEEIFENREQIEISKYYERLPKSPAVAIQELLDEKILIRKRVEEI